MGGGCKKTMHCPAFFYPLLLMKVVRSSGGFCANGRFIEGNDSIKKPYQILQACLILRQDLLLAF
jgi:hypothetical protein